MGLRSNGSVAAWGMCDVDQCTLPIPNTGFVAVAAGDSFSLGLKSDGTLVAWGSFDQDDIPQPNRGYLAMTANQGLVDAVRAPAPDGTFSDAPPNSTSGLETRPRSPPTTTGTATRKSSRRKTVRPQSTCTRITQL